MRQDVMNPLVTFFILAYIITWGLYLAADSTSVPSLRTFLLYSGVFTPGLLALWFTRRAEGFRGLVALLRRLIQWQVPARWYIFALTYLATVKLTVALLYRAATGGWPRFGDVPWYLLVAATLGSTVLGGQVGEELGWRGYALPKLTMRLGLGGASLLLGVLWAGWHLPLFFILGGDTVGQSFPLYVLQVTAVSVAIAWLYAKTRGSLLLTMLLHAAVNNTKDIVPSAVPGATQPWALSTSLVAWLTVVILWAAAVYFLVDMRRMDLSVPVPVRASAA
jgi:hypothetical protein